MVFCASGVFVLLVELTPATATLGEETLALTASAVASKSLLSAGQCLENCSRSRKVIHSKPNRT